MSEERYRITPKGVIYYALTQGYLNSDDAEEASDIILRSLLKSGYVIYNIDDLPKAEP